MKLKLTTKEFDGLKDKLTKLIKGWWKTEQGDFSNEEFPSAAPQKPDIWSSIPKIDSKVAIKVSTVLEAEFGQELHPSLVKQGGYESIGELIEDLLGKLRQCCSDVKPKKKKSA